MDIRIAIAAPVPAVWSRLGDLAAHSDWMSDAESVEFTTRHREGVGTRVRVRTKIGPLRLVDEMTVTDWVENSLIGADHVGSVRGSGRFEIGGDGEATTLLWSENLEFPWWMGGRAGYLLARPILRRIWEGNLRRLKQLVETETTGR